MKAVSTANEFHQFLIKKLTNGQRREVAEYVGAKSERDMRALYTDLTGSVNPPESMTQVFDGIMLTLTNMAAASKVAV